MPADIIAIVAFKGISPFHLSVPCMVFGEDRIHRDMPRFDVRVCAAERGELSTSAGFTLRAAHGLEAIAVADIVIVPSWRDPDELPPAALMHALQAAHRRGVQIVGLCLGAFVLAAAGLLDEREAATHWAYADRLAGQYPQVRVNHDVLYVDDGKILTSAGVAAGIDCCLHLLRRRYGAEVASATARRMVVPPHRQGGQAQYIERPLHVSDNTDRFGDVMNWMTRNLDQALSLDALANRALMSRRTFTRRFKQVTGASVGQWLLNQRIALAQRLLETTNKSIEVIAQQSGFRSALSLRQHFQAQLGTSPIKYRREFAGR